MVRVMCMDQKEHFGREGHRAASGIKNCTAAFYTAAYVSERGAFDRLMNVK